MTQNDSAQWVILPMRYIGISLIDMLLGEDERTIRKQEDFSKVFGSVWFTWS